MKDLYSKLGIDRNASAGEVQAALEARPEMGECSAILLSAEKRAIYDSTHSTLKMIGGLRHKLGLDSGHSWFLDHCPDFAPKQAMAKPPTDPARDTRAGSSPGASPEPQPPQSLAPQPAARPRWAIPVLVLVAAAILVAVLLF